MNQSSERLSPGPSTTLSCHCIRRWVLVKVPAFSPASEAGIRKISVPMSSGRISPSRTRMAVFCQKVAVSISAVSRTTSHSRFARPRWISASCCRP
jgi:hypothetical protein